MPRYGKKTDQEVLEPIKDVEKGDTTLIWWSGVSVSAMLVETRQKNIAQAFILERYFFVSICPAASHGTCLSVFLAAVLLLC